MNIFVDKIEDMIAELHFNNGEVLHLNINELPNNTKEGDYLKVNFILNNNEKIEVENNVEKLIKGLSDDSIGGDFEL